MRVAVLTSSRADYSNYYPLLQKLNTDPFFELKIIAFGTHTSSEFGNTVDIIRNDGFPIAYELKTLAEGGGRDPESIATSMAITIEKFAKVWTKEKNNLDLIICLGDRYEMFAAVSSTVPFNIPLAHLYGGDTTVGAIDDAFRHAITIMSQYHFVSLEISAKRVAQLKGNPDNIHIIGSLSLDNLNSIQLLTEAQFETKYNIKLESPILLTFHPETVAYSKNEKYIHELIAALETTGKQIIITMPNADTMGQIIRETLIEFASRKKNVFTVESLGTVGYFSCISHCSFIIGNSSSGIVEAASFGKYVINLGNRQQGRPVGNNVLNCEIDKNKIIKTMKQIDTMPALSNYNIYGDGKAAEKVIHVLKSIK